MFGRLISGNFRRPSGFIGRLVGNMMARGNAYEARWTVSLLDIQPGDHILEVGFGPGLAVQLAAQKAVKGLVAGIDYSETMVRAARQRNVDAIKADRVDLQLGDVSSLPYPNQSFDKAYAIHCIYFWARPLEVLKELRRVLQPSGLLAVTIQPKDQWPPERTPPPDIFALYDGAEVALLFSDAGLRDVRVEQSPEPDKFPGVCVLGVK